MIKLPKLLSYTPPVRHAKECNLASRFRKSNYLFLSEAVDLLGKIEFGQQWSGEEICVRRISERFVEQKIQHLTDHRLDSDDGLRHLVERWAVFTEEGEMLFETKKEAIEAAEQREIYTISSYYG